MSLPFPGMEPYLEHPALWPGVHNHWIVCALAALQPQLRPRYVAIIEQRVYIEESEQRRQADLGILRAEPVGTGGGVAVAARPATEPLILELAGLEAKETYLDILDLYADRRLVTQIELVSPSNKKPGAGRRAYLEKQVEVLERDVNLVEIDLLRTGKHVMAVPLDEARRRAGPYDYLAAVSRWGNRRVFELYPSRLREPLPRVRLPLGEADADAVLDLRETLLRVYEEGAYDARLRHGEPCVPPLSAADQAWADELLRRAGAFPT